MIGHYLSSNNETCYSDFSPNFSRTKRGLEETLKIYECFFRKSRLDPHAAATCEASRISIHLIFPFIVFLDTTWRSCRGIRPPLNRARRPCYEHHLTHVSHLCLLDSVGSLYEASPTSLRPVSKACFYCTVIYNCAG